VAVVAVVADAAAPMGMIQAQMSQLGMTVELAATVAAQFVVAVAVAAEDKIAEEELSTEAACLACRGFVEPVEAAVVVVVAPCANAVPRMLDLLAQLVAAGVEEKAVVAAEAVVEFGDWESRKPLQDRQMV